MLILCMLIYRSVLKPILFRIDPEKTHDLATRVGHFLGSYWITRMFIRFFYSYSDYRLETSICGIRFNNPVGLAAGFDYGGQLTRIIPCVGFGAETIGSVTYQAYEGNAPPRLERLPKSQSLLVNKGLKNKGVKTIIASLAGSSFVIPLGISVAKTNCKETCTEKEGIHDYIQTLMFLQRSGIGDYYELNISCPNAFGGEPFTTPQKLERLLKQVDLLKLKKPLFLKMPVDFSFQETWHLCDVAARHCVDGLIFGNLTKNRKNPVFDIDEIQHAGKGNFSGKPTEKKSNDLLAFVYKKYKKRFVLIGCGGIFSADDAYEKIKNGASIVQLITGMIYQGPGLIKEINKGLVSLLERDGFTNIHDAIGKNIR